MQLSDLQETPRFPHWVVSLLLLIGLFLVLSGIFQAIGLYVFFPEPYRDISFLIEALNNDELAPSFLSTSLLAWQGFTALAGFVLTPIAYLLLKDKPLLNETRHQPSPMFGELVVVLALTICIQPLVSGIYSANQQITLPENLSGLETAMKAMEAQAKDLVDAMTKVSTPMEWLLMVLVVAIIPGFGEELFFRGVLQKVLIRAGLNVHIGIWLTAFLFSALHLQFYGFLPRMLLGAAFGYMYALSGKLVLPMIAHMTNNFMALVLVSLTGDTNPETPYTWLLVAISVPILYLLGNQLRKPIPAFLQQRKEQWVIVFTTPLAHRAELVSSILAGQNIRAMVINKMDSNFLFGEYYVYVPFSDKSSAQNLIADGITFE